MTLDETIHEQLMEMYVHGWRDCANRLRDLIDASEETRRLYELLMAGKQEDVIRPQVQ